ncbi:MAG: hypothetical protein K9J37_16740 [Saprospiraceae bacterium]|nr:hypothetical protein [Saprospiraceae bacterium]MCF8251563.1 hypothetical protein [Saprospiraceae bacterium]MCF8310927.1 hypothetical protein [Saprospiraceae bacterium]MCF8439737.1 hypothetical protein [Saprospiraceae bacterium]
MMKTALLALVTTCLGFYYLPKTDLVISSPENSGNYSLNFCTHELKGTTDLIADPELVTSYKAKVIQEVFKQLKNARGDFNSMRPTLRFVKKHGGVGPAYAQSKIKLIYFEEKAYDICASMGKDSLNALAVILSHELIHVYEKHEWELYFASDNRNNSLGGEVVDKAKDDEIQADYLGGFLSYQAGFSTIGTMDKLIDKIYQEYGLPIEHPNYPSKEERKTLAKQSEVKLTKLLELFEMGNMLAAMEEYDEALEYYFKVLEDFESREIFNNLGVLSTLVAIKKFAPTENLFTYPVILDEKSRLNGSRDGEDKKAAREQKLMEAIDFFKKAQQFDSYYPIAHVNEGCAHALLGLSQKELGDLGFAQK